MAKHDMGVKIRFHKGAWWLFINHRNQRRAKKMGDRQTALRTAQQVREAIVAGDLALTPKPPPETVQAYAQAWLRGLELNLKASTVRFYREHLDRHVLPLLGHRPLRALRVRTAESLSRSADRRGCV